MVMSIISGGKIYQEHLSERVAMLRPIILVVIDPLVLVIYVTEVVSWDRFSNGYVLLMRIREGGIV